MIRWLRVVAFGTVIVAMIGLGVCVGLFLVANGGWVQVNVPPWLTWLFGDPKIEMWLPAMIAGWLVTVVGVVIALAWSMYYVWRRRQYEALIGRLERELAALRNLPFTNPAPLEDLPETPNEDAARVLARAEAYAGDDDDVLGARD
ncbi:MAG TPA: hypothetical protein VML75_26545 [Kofleriaceae bacterium]|nr:hypothetical protein [Kofleriaceae bacterium]